MKNRLVAIVLIFGGCLLLGGCLLNPPYYYDEPESAGEVAKLIFRLAFVKPWILVPALWHLIETGDFLVPLQGMVVALIIGGIHIGLGSLLMNLHRFVPKEKSTSKLGTMLIGLVSEVGQPFGAGMTLYGAFLWLSCFVVNILSLLLD